MSARWKPYPRYKDSGVEWLGRIPEHWQTWKLAHAFGEIGSGTTPNTRRESYFDGEVPWVTTSELRERLITDTETKLTNRAILDHSALRIYQPGTLLFAMYGATIGRLGFLGIPACVNQACCALGRSNTVRPRFAFLTLWAARHHLISMASGGGQPNVNQEKLRTLRLPVPTTEEQHSIAAFLDRETGKIDALVAKKERLIELLQEKRTALISHAVTQGLNPDAPKEDSGIPWLGRIPAHWQVLKLKFIADGARGSFTDGDWIESPFITNEGIRLLQCGNVGTGLFEEQGFRYITEDTFRQFQCSEVFPGDILICRLRSSQNILAGRACVAPDLGRRMITSVDNCILRPSDEHDSSYLVYQMSLPEYLGFVEEIARGGTRDRISRSMLADFKFATPPRYEQAQIAGHLDHETSKLDALMAKVQAAIERLQEYRTALISAAVTGQIDVRSATMCARGGDAGGFEG